VDIFVEPAFSAVVNGDRYSIKGRAKPFADSRESSIELSVKGIDVTRYLAYLPVKMKARIVSAVVDVDSIVSFLQRPDSGPALVVSANLALKDLAIDDHAKKPLIRLPSADIDIASLELFARRAHLSSLIIDAPEVSVTRDKEGRFSLQDLVPTGASAEATPKEMPDGEEGDGFVAVLDRFELKKGKIVFSDAAAVEPVNIRLEEMDLGIRGFSTEKGSKAKMRLSARLAKSGRLTAEGTIGVEPMAANLALEVKGLPVGPFQPYFQESLRIALLGGNLALKGNVAVRGSKSGEPSVIYTGNLLVSNVASIDQNQGNDFIKWKTLSFSSLKAGINPLFVHTGGIALADFYTRVAVNSDGTLNLHGIVADDPQPAVPEKGAVAESFAGTTKPQDKEEPAPDIEVGSLTLQGGTIDFSDHLIKPNYNGSLNEIGGRISGLSMKPGHLADVELRGKLDNSVPLEITGKINPSKQSLLVDLAFKFHDLDLSPMTPYSGKYIGYSIEKGKLSLDLKYLIAKRELKSENRIFFDQFTLGDRVESPDAIKLPVRLAVALLKDRHGRIELDVPVTGSIDDPQFSVGRIIIKVILNIITKAVTSPFALLGSLFGGGEELSYAEFQYGSSSMTQEASKKIETLAKALNERPGLRLEIEGHGDIEKDGGSLKTRFFERKIKAQKAKDMARTGETVPAVDDIIVDEPEYEKYLTLAYKAEKFAKPKNIIGLTKSLPPEEMEKLILTHTTVTDDDLRALAKERAIRIKDALLATGKVTADRIFIVEPKSIAPEKKEKAKDARVDFTLK
jgi:hypothetical protein